MEDHEFDKLEVAALGEAAEAAGLEWHHLAIRDVDIPREPFERLWVYSGHVLRKKLTAGERVVLHCRGGLGRTGTVATRLAIELGAQPREALGNVRAARPKAVETDAQEAYALRQKPFAKDETRADRILGCLLGGAVGDALGYAVEFDTSLSRIRERFGAEGIQEPVLDSAGRARVSDDTQMTVFTAEGFLAGLEETSAIQQAAVLESVRTETLNWHAMQQGGPGKGRLSAFAVLGQPRAPGTTCMAACARGATGTPESPINQSKGCGGVMRVAPVGLHTESSDAEAFELAARCAAQTHGHPSGYLSAGAMAAIVRNLVGGMAANDCVHRAIEIARQWHSAEDTVDALHGAMVLADRSTEDRASAIGKIGEGWVGEEALAIGVYSVLAASNFRDAVRLASNHVGDSDSTASIAGQVYGAWRGLEGIPHAWIRRLDALQPVVDVAGRMIANTRGG